MANLRSPPTQHQAQAQSHVREHVRTHTHLRTLQAQRPMAIAAVVVHLLLIRTAAPEGLRAKCQIHQLFCCPVRPLAQPCDLLLLAQHLVLPGSFFLREISLSVALDRGSRSSMRGRNFLVSSGWAAPQAAQPRFGLPAEGAIRRGGDPPVKK